MPTNYATDTEAWNHTREDDEPNEQPCPRCRGRYPKIDACIECEGNGTVLV
ncbi:hypothetical protein [Streptomyces sp. H27-C3]|uniref:hypothetical protein n=1 Tax=Streptomyces sp. H27-C3 TaxID=3046305 RepID=UPI0024BBC12B|nr:hypothetical protein [Streptomyces sp. H27-C3]MDJ0463199.1 hypothetical protein [Streptomyces sp. H27-C3]